MAAMSEIPDLVLGGMLARILKFMSLARVRPNMSAIVSNMFVGGENHPRFLVSKQIDAILDLRTRKAEKYASFIRKLKKQYLKKGVPDGSGFSLEDLRYIVEWISTRDKEGKRILVHCNLGRGRSCLVAATYLVYLGLDTQRALAIVKRKRLVSHLNERQLETLREFANSCAPTRNLN